jgi:hypothetical protein
MHSDSEEEEEDDNYESDEEDEYDRGHWKWRLQHPRKVPAYAAMECYDEDDDEPNSYDVFPAECTEKERTTRQARDAAVTRCNCRYTRKL